MNSILDQAIAKARRKYSQVRQQITFVPPPALDLALRNTTKHLRLFDLHQTQFHRPHKLRADLQLASYVQVQTEWQMRMEQLQQARDQWGMLHEEQLQEASASLEMALERKRDYALYLEYAVTYHTLSEKEFNATDWPGRLLRVRLRSATQRIHSFYKFWKPFRERRKQEACIHFQRLGRGYMVRRKYGPVRAIFHRKQCQHMRQHIQAWAKHHRYMNDFRIVFCTLCEIALWL